MTEPTELPLHCPFCGHAGPLDFQDGSTHRWGVAYCAECGASAGETRREYPDVGGWHAKAIAQWNTRTPQPTQPQAGAVPLTDEQIEALPLWKRFVGLWPETRREIVRTIEHHHGIKGGQHVGKVD